MIFSKNPIFRGFIFKTQKSKTFFAFFCCGLDILCAGKISKWIFQASWVQSNIQSSIHHQNLISLESPHELRWILIMMEAHAEDLCEVKKKKMPPRDLQFPQSPVNLNISTKWRDSQGQRRRLYLHKSWEESSRQVKKKKRQRRKPLTPMSTSQSCVSISFCASVTPPHIPLSFLLLFFTIHVFCLPVLLSVGRIWKPGFNPFISCLSLCGCSSALTILGVIFQLARSSRSGQKVLWFGLKCRYIIAKIVTHPPNQPPTKKQILTYLVRMFHKSDGFVSLTLTLTLSKMLIGRISGFSMSLFCHGGSAKVHT